MQRIYREIIYPYPIAQVWEALSSQEALSSWFMSTDFEAVVGKQFSFKTKPAPGFDGVVKGVVLVVEPPHKLVYSWQGGPLKKTKVSFQLKEVQEGTKLTFEHSGFTGLSELFPRFILGSGWKGLLTKNLYHWLESQYTEGKR